MQVKEIINAIEEYAPLSYQEEYDNSGLQVGSAAMEAKKALICLDITLSVVEEALEHHCNVIISHHPLIFNGIKKISDKNYIEKIITIAIKNDIAIYSAHTHLDNVSNGVNKTLAEVLGLKNYSILKPAAKLLRKLVTFCPIESVEKVREALFAAGAGKIGNYDCCSSNTLTEGTFRANLDANPFVGEKGKLHLENEIRIETIFPYYIENQIVDALISAHPYEEVAFDIYPLENKFTRVGSGMMGELIEEVSGRQLMETIREKLKVPMLRYSGALDKKVKKIAICGGSGAFLIKDALRRGADVFLSSDIKYHAFGDYSDKLLLIDAGHFETEQFTKHLLCEILNEKFPTFATRISEQDNNLVKYFI